GGRLTNWLVPALGDLQEHANPVLSKTTITVGTLVLAALGVLVAYLVVGRHPVPVERPVPVSWPVRAARADLYGNALNETLVARPGQWLTGGLVFTDKMGVDGLVNGIAALIGGTSGRLRRLQTGFVRSYALTMLGGAILLVAALLFVRFSA
ncbi:MAG TPA: NADH-quinone oxidoreductase subunit L, partial [Pseudonocardiaceae bacterium]